MSRTPFPGDGRDCGCQRNLPMTAPFAMPPLFPTPHHLLLHTILPIRSLLASTMPQNVSGGRNPLGNRKSTNRNETISDGNPMRLQTNPIIASCQILCRILSRQLYKPNSGKPHPWTTFTQPQTLPNVSTQTKRTS